MATNKLRGEEKVNASNFTSWLGKRRKAWPGEKVKNTNPGRTPPN